MLRLHRLTTPERRRPPSVVVGVAKQRALAVALCVGAGSEREWCYQVGRTGGRTSVPMPAGNVNCEMSLSGKTYRAFGGTMDGYPGPPARGGLTQSRGKQVTVWASWNGDTQVASRQILACPASRPCARWDRPDARPVSRPRLQ